MIFKLTQLINEIISYEEHKNYIEQLRVKYNANFTYHIPRQDIIKNIYIETDEKLPDGFMDKLFRRYGVSPVSLD